MQYMPEGNFTASLHSSEDVFWGQLAGCLEMIDGGTTTVVDFAHINQTPEHSESHDLSGSPHVCKLTPVVAMQTTK